jgi:S1-C subfamily serine protease
MIPLVALLFLVGGAFADKPATAQVKDQPAAGSTRALKATVLVLTPDNNGELLASGSGTVMDADKGYILTNYHVLGNTQSAQLFNEQGLAIIGVMPANLKGAPILKFYAELVADDPALDLAVLQITALFDDPKARLPKNLGLTAIERANSEQLNIGDELFVIGYPGLGGNTVTMSKGLVSGFLDDNNDDLFEWIKTDAEVNHGNSGGLATNARWQFIGVPSAGVADVEAAGKISLIRMGNLALQFYDGIQAGSHGRQQAGEAHITAVEFGQAINRRNQISRPQTQFASGVTDLYATFVYEGFRAGQELTTVWYVDGKQGLSDRFAWGEAESGRSWTSIYNEQGLADGLYELELIWNGQSLYRGGVRVGEVARAGCDFGPISFASAIEDGGRPVKPGSRFSNLTLIYAVFPVSDMRNGVSWRTVWSYEGRSILEEEQVWSLGNIDSQWVSLSHPDGLPAGEFTLELFCGEERVQQGDFQILSRAERPHNTVQVTGTVYDRDSKRRKIEGALVVLLNPGVRIEEWVNADFSEEMIFAKGTSNASGAYQLDARVTPGDRYSVVVVHERYEPASEEDYLIPADANHAYELNVALERK